MAIENNAGKGKKTKISIVIPALNEEEGIEKTLQAIPKSELEDMGYEVQILVVDNGSTDDTVKVAQKAGAEVVLEPRRGYGRAYKTGFARAAGDIIATGDGDSSYPVQDILKFVRILEEDSLEFITTNRLAQLDGNAMSLQNRLGNALLNLTARLLFKINLKDSQSGMWLFKRSILDNLLLRSDGMPFSEELKLEACYFARCRWKELPISYKARVGRIKLRVWRDGFQNLFYLIKKRVIR